MTPNERNEQVITDSAVARFLEQHERDLHKCNLWIVNDIIVSLWDYSGCRPTVDMVKNNWRFDYNKLDDVTDDEIADTICKVSRFYN